MSELKVTARIDTVFPPETKGNFTFSTIWATVDHESNYPQICEFQAGGQKSGIFAGYNEGDIVDLHLNLRGRAWTNPQTNEKKVFNTLSVWKVERAAGQSAQPVYQNPAARTQPVPNGGNYYNPTPETKYDLPF